MNRVIDKVAEILREGLEFAIPYTAIETALEYIDGINAMEEELNGQREEI